MQCSNFKSRSSTWFCVFSLGQTLMRKQSADVPKRNVANNGPWFEKAPTSGVPTQTGTRAPMPRAMRALRAVFALALVSAVAADTTPPNFSAGYPSVTAVTGSQFTLNVKSNEAGKAYYYVVAGASPTPPTPATT